MRLWREKINLASTKNNNKLWKRELKYSEICLNLHIDEIHIIVSFFLLNHSAKCQEQF
jgi:hypothetical protein